MSHRKVGESGVSSADYPILDQFGGSTVILIVDDAVVKILAILLIQPQTIPQHALCCTRLGILILESQPFRHGFQTIAFNGQDETLGQHFVQIDKSVQQFIR